MYQKLEKFADDQSAVSPVVGVILMVAVTVILAAVIGAFVLDLGNNTKANPQAGVSFSENPSTGEVTVTAVSIDNADQLVVTVDGSAEATLDSVGDSATITPIGRDVSVVGVLDNKDAVLQSYEPEPVAYSSAPTCSEVSHEDADGDGVLDVSNPHELQCISSGDDYELTSDIDATPTLIWSDGAGFDPVSFNDNFEGNGYTIDGLYINRGSENHVGLFGYTYTPEIHNLSITNADVTGDESVGILVGESSSGGEFSNIYTSGKVKAESDEAGGIVGTSETNLTESYSSADVTAVLDTAGGLVGYNGFSTDSTVTNSYSTGTIVVEGDGYTSFPGGAIGYYNSDSIENVYWNTETSGQSEAYGGGFVDAENETNVEGLTTSQMQGENAKTNMSGLDFENVWTTVEGDYPKLQSEE